MTKRLLEQDIKVRRCTGGGPAFRTLAAANPCADMPMWQRRYLQKTANVASDGYTWDEAKLSTLRQCVRHTPEALTSAAEAVTLKGVTSRPASASTKCQSPRVEERKVVDRHVRKLVEPVRNTKGENRPS